MSKVEQLHNQAMDLAEDAFIAKRKGDGKEAIRLFSEALDFEKKAASFFPPNEESEPTRSILYRSAASIAYNSGDYETADRLIAFGLSGYPPIEIKNELKNLYEDINFMRHLSAKGLSLDMNQFMMTIAGDAIRYGGAFAENLMERVEVIIKLFYRTLERLLNFDYRISGGVSKEIKDKYGLYIQAFVPSSFAVSFQVGYPDPQLALFQMQKNNKALESLPLEPSSVIDEMMRCFEIFENDDNIDNLKNRFEDDYYFENFLALTKQLAPDGEDVKLVGFTSIKNGEEKPVALRKSRKQLRALSNIHINDDSDDAIIPVSYTGTLKYASSTSKDKFGKVKLIDSKGITHDIKVPISLMKDVVQPYYEEYLTIHGYKKNGKIYLDEITKEEQ